MGSPAPSVPGDTAVIVPVKVVAEVVAIHTKVAVKLANRVVAEVPPVGQVGGDGARGEILVSWSD